MPTHQTDRAMPMLIGGRLCLDFTNTTGGRGGEIPDEFLGDYGRLVAWARHVGVLSEEEAAALSARAERRPDEAASVYDHAIELRECLYRVFSAFGRGARPTDDDLATVHRAYVGALDSGRLSADRDGVRWEWRSTAGDLDLPLRPILQSAVEVLMSDDLRRIKECPGAEGPCTWLFIDVSKAGRRRWCSMAECGGVAKARRQTVRRRTARTSGNARPDSKEDM